jgi:hypothetical protein
VEEGTATHRIVCELGQHLPQCVLLCQIQVRVSHELLLVKIKNNKIIASNTTKQTNKQKLLTANINGNKV